MIHFCLKALVDMEIKRNKDIENDDENPQQHDCLCDISRVLQQSLEKQNLIYEKKRKIHETKVVNNLYA